MKLTKSLAELDAAADELLAKSKAAEEGEDLKDDEVKPEEISDDSVTPTDQDADDTEEEKDDVKKSDEPEEVEEDESEDDTAEDAGDDGTDDDEAEEVKKSIKDEFDSNDDVVEAVSKSEFLSAITEVLVKSLGDVQYDVVSGNKGNQQATEILAKSLQASLAVNKQLQSDNERLVRRINKMEKSITQGFERLQDSLDEISSQPVGMRKSLVSVHDRDFERSLGGTPQVGFESLSKSQVLNVLNNEIYSGNQNVTVNDIISYESGAPLRQDLQSLVASKCK